MKIIYFVSLALGLLCAPVLAQRSLENVEIIDVLPAVDPGIAPELPFLSCDFLIGAQLRPAWWGQSFRDVGLNGRDISAFVERSDGQKQTKEVCEGASVSEPQWNEALGLYIVHARFYWEVKGWKWPRNARFTVSGLLAAPFSIEKDAARLPFALEFSTPEKGQFPRASLSSPQPQMWVRSVRISSHEGKTELGRLPHPFEARITVAGRRIEKRIEPRYMPEFFVEDGANRRVFGNYGVEGGLGADREITNLLLAGSEIEFVTYRIVFDEEVFNSAPSLWARHTVQLGGRAPLTVSFPIKRDGVLVGEVAPQEWKIAPFAAKVAKAATDSLKSPA